MYEINPVNFSIIKEYKSSKQAAVENDLNYKILQESHEIQPIEYILQKIRHICCLKINICNIIYKQ